MSFSNSKEVLTAWCDAVEARDVDLVVSLYAQDAILLGTFSPTLRRGSEALRDYFTDFLHKDGVKVQITDQALQDFGDIVVHSGLYSFLLKTQGKAVTIPARFTFVFQHVDRTWHIAEHHSSMLPNP